MVSENMFKQKKHCVTSDNSSVCQEKLDTKLVLRTQRFLYYYTFQGYILIRNNYHIITLVL